MPQRVSPSSPENACGLTTRSPQTAHTPPAIGRIAARHTSQTGSREMLIKGAPQRRQSEGKRVANRLSAIPPREEIREATNTLRCFTSLISVVRVGHPLLLKTSLPRPVGATGAPPGRIPLSIARTHSARNRRDDSRRGALHRTVHFWAFPHFYKGWSVISSEAIAATYRAQSHEWQNPSLQEISRP
jgi:hypothetical protein